MQATIRSTTIVQGRLAMREGRLDAALNRRQGLQIMTFEQAAVRLAGGFSRSIDVEALRSAIQEALPVTPLGELEQIKGLPGMISAAADTLQKVWRSGVDLQHRHTEHPRLQALAALETSVLAVLPPGMMRPSDIVSAAMSRLDFAGSVFGEIEIHATAELAPCWRPLLEALAQKTKVVWKAGPRFVPEWLKARGVIIETCGAELPQTLSVSAATAYHESVEAIRWVRSLLVSGVSPSDIAIASASCSDYDGYFYSLKADANIDIHFAHGMSCVATRDGQAAAALADIIVRGVSQTRLRRLAALCKECKPLAALPDGWLRVLPGDAPLSTPLAWSRLLGRLEASDWPDGVNHAPTLKAAVEVLLKGVESAAEVGESFLKGPALSLWRKALLAGPASSIDLTLQGMKQDDGLDACVSVTWMPASFLAASPRRYVRLLGLNSARWPRGISEDRLIPDHIIPSGELDPLPISLGDRRDFETILATTSTEVVLSRARRDGDGRLLGRSPLVSSKEGEVYLRRNQVPEAAFSETDRLMSRPEEFQTNAQALSAHACWRNWRKFEVTAHDGVIRPNHPVILSILDRTQSASSLKTLLRNPLGFVWKYGLGWRTPESGVEPLVLDSLASGDLIHLVLDSALSDLETSGGLASADITEIRRAVASAAARISENWEAERPIPPMVIWRRTLDEARVVSESALSYGNSHLPGTRSYSEVPFGRVAAKSMSGNLPWDPTTPVTIPGAGFNIGGYIDRLDVSSDGGRALVRDYKTGRAPKGNIRLDGGKELQRCFYAFAVKALLGPTVEISASLLYPKEPLDLQLDDPEGALADISEYLKAARSALVNGSALPGPDTCGEYDDLAFALPANARATYCKRKQEASIEALSGVAPIWEME